MATAENPPESEPVVSSEDEDSSDEEEFPDNDLPQQKEVPKDIVLNSHVVSIALHPKEKVIGIGTIEGNVSLYAYGLEDSNRELETFPHLKKMCRSVVFDESGEFLFSAFQDATIQVIDIEKKSVVRKFSRPTGSPLFTLLSIDENLLASGDDDGEVTIWDHRKPTQVAFFENNGGYISSLALNKDSMTLLATCGEGTLSAYDVSNRSMELQSEPFDSEFLSLGIVKDRSKVVVGAGDGALNIFNWNEWGNISDRFPGHPGSVDSMVVVKDEIVCTGCEDGKIRAVQMFPNRFLGVVGSHSGFTVECLSISQDCTLLASCSHDQKVKFWDLTMLDEAKAAKVEKSGKNDSDKPLSGTKDDFFSDMA